MKLKDSKNTLLSKITALRNTNPTLVLITIKPSPMLISPMMIDKKKNEIWKIAKPKRP